MFIFKDTKKRANIHTPYTDADGVRYSQIPRELLEEISDPTPPVDYSDDTYYRTEQDEAPYVIYTRKSDEQIQQVMLTKFIAALEGHYDRVAQARKYDNRLTCALRAGYAGPFQAEGQAFAIWMDNCNAYGYAELGKVLAGQRPLVLSSLWGQRSTWLINSSPTALPKCPASPSSAAMSETATRTARLCTVGSGRGM